MDNASLFFSPTGSQKEFSDVLRDVQEYLSGKYSALISRNPYEQKQQITAHITKYLNDYRLGVEDMGFEELVERLYAEMVEFSFLTQYMFSKNIEEININAWDDIKITYSDGRIEPAKEKFNSPSHAVDIVRRILHKSNMILDNSQPVIRGHLSNKIRITVFGNPIIDSDKGVAASIRIVNPMKLTREDFIRSGTATPDMLEFLSAVLRHGVSMCVTGATGSGKTTLMSWILSTIPNDKRIVTIENGCREFDLVKRDELGNTVNNAVHLTTRESDDSRQHIDQDKLLEFTLTFNPDLIVVGECKSAEAMAAIEAALTGHGVITTTHANSCRSTYYRLVTLCRQKYDMDEKTLHNLATEAFPIVLFAKRLEDNSRKIMEITECEIHEDGRRELRTLYRYNVVTNETVDGKARITGCFEKANDISNSLQKRLLENGMPQETLKKILKGDFAV